MHPKEFTRLLVTEVVDNNPPDSRGFISENGIDISNLNDADVIWKAFVRYNIDAYGVRSGIVWKYWNLTSDEAILKQRTKLIEKILDLQGLKCYSNFTFHCPVTYASGEFLDIDKCYLKGSLESCPVIDLINELKWHRAHHRVAKILVEDAKRLLIDDKNGSKDGNLNNVVNGILEKYPDDKQGRTLATKELLSKFDDIKGYGNPPKVITWFLSEMSSPVHQVNHWPNLDHRQLSPVDTHVQRLMVRFGFIDSKVASNKNIETELSKLYPEEPRKLDFALYRLGADLEEGICAKTPNCELCKEKHFKLFQNCQARQI